MSTPAMSPLAAPMIEITPTSLTWLDDGFCGDLLKPRWWTFGESRGIGEIETFSLLCDEFGFLLS